MFSFPKDKYEALEEVRGILGFTEAELRNFLSLLERSQGYLRFAMGNVNIEFHARACFELPLSEVGLEVQVKERGIEHTAKYEFRHRARKSQTPMEY